MTRKLREALEHVSVGLITPKEFMVEAARLYDREPQEIAAFRLECASAYARHLDDPANSLGDNEGDGAVTV
jgi:hypothetical protein